MKNIGYLLMIIFLVSCQKETDENSFTGLVTNLSPVWKTSNTDGLDVTGDLPIRIINNKIITLGKRGEQSIIYGKSVADGKIHWTWDDVLTQNEKIVTAYPFYHNSNIHITRFGRTYSIDSNTGNTIWNYENNKHCNSTITGNNDNIFIACYSNEMPNDSSGFSIFQMNLANGSFEREIIPNYQGKFLDPRNNIGDIMSIHLFENNENQNLLYMAYYDPTGNDWDIQPRFSIYNLTTEAWELDSIKISGIGDGSPVQNKPVIANDKIIVSLGSVKKMVCHDLNIGQQLWEKQFTGSFGSSGFIYIEEHNVLFGVNENGIMYKINPEDGSIIWERQASGSSSDPHYQDGVVYFVGGGNGLLHAVDINNGAFLWKLESPDRESFRREVTGIPAQNGEKGKIFTSSYINTYCFEAVY